MISCGVFPSPPLFNDALGTINLFIQTHDYGPLRYLRNEQLNPPPPHCLWFITKVRCCSIYIHNVYVHLNVSVIAPNTTIVAYGILFGGMHPVIDHKNALNK